MTSGTLRYRILLLLMISGLTTPLTAQDVPGWEIHGGVSMQRSNVRQYFRTTPVVFGVRNEDVNLFGWAASVTENRNRWFGGTIDVRGHYMSPDVRGVPNSARMYTLMYGPRVNYRLSALTPFAHVLVGAAHARARVTPVGPNVSDYSLAVAAGGGVDLRFGGQYAIRILQAEYLRANALGSKPHGFRASVGFVYYTGSK